MSGEVATWERERQERRDLGLEDHWDDPANPDLHPCPAPVVAERDDPEWVGVRRCAHRSPRAAGQPVRCPRFTDGAPLCPEHEGER